METPIDVFEHGEDIWKGMLDIRRQRLDVGRPDHSGALIHTAYQKAETLGEDLIVELSSLTQSLVNDFNDRFELSPSAMVDLRTTLTTAVSCGAQLAATATFEMGRLTDFVAPADAEDYIYDAMNDYCNEQKQIITVIWNGVNN